MSKLPRAREHHKRDFAAYLRWYRRNPSFYPRDYPLVERDRAISTLTAFVAFEGQGKVIPCRHPRVLRAVLRGKGRLNFQIKEWAQGWFDCGGRYAFENEIKVAFPWLPEWVWAAVEEQHWNYA